jgi:2-alkenal reductase
MKINKVLFIALLIPALLLAAFGGATLAINTFNQPVRAAAAVQDVAPQVGASITNTSDLQTTFEQIYENVNPSVVNIQVIETGTTQFGVQGTQSGLGSGFVWDQQGHIVTNAHVVDGADQIGVTFADGTMVSAKLVGADPYSDLAVIKVDVPAERLHPVELADSTLVKVGQIAIAIGNPFGLQGTMTQGIISGLSRSLPVDTQTSFSQQGGRYSIPDIIQTDASINPGNSGGVLVDEQGKVIGVTSAIASSTQSNSGVGFVIPSAIVKKNVPTLIQAGKVQHTWMGVMGTSLTPDLVEAANLPKDQQGAFVLSVTPGSPAEKAGLRGGRQEVTVGGEQVNLGGDVIIAVDGHTVKRFEDIVSYLYNNTDPGQTITLTVLRQGKQMELQLTLGVLPSAS